jgi:hypothetical protein
MSPLPDGAQVSKRIIELLMMGLTQKRSDGLD